MQGTTPQTSGRLRPLPPVDNPEVRAALDAVSRMLGFIPNSLLIMQRVPEIVLAFAKLAASVNGPGGKVDLGLKRLISHVASRAAGCQYCMAHTIEGAHLAGVDDAKLAEMQDRAHRYCFIANTLADSVTINIL